MRGQCLEKREINNTWFSGSFKDVINQQEIYENVLQKNVRREVKKRTTEGVKVKGKRSNKGREKKQTNRGEGFLNSLKKRKNVTYRKMKAITGKEND